MNKFDKTIQDLERLIESEPIVKPAIDIIEKDDDFIVKVYMPGVSKENIFLKLEDSILTIFGKIDFNSHEDEKFILKEKCYGNYFRQITLSDKIDTSKIQAKLENGLLNIVLPKYESIKPKVISIH